MGRLFRKIWKKRRFIDLTRESQLIRSIKRNRRIGRRVRKAKQGIIK